MRNSLHQSLTVFTIVGTLLLSASSFAATYRLIEYTAETIDQYCEINPGYGIQIGSSSSSKNCESAKVRSDEYEAANSPSFVEFTLRKCFEDMNDAPFASIDNFIENLRAGVRAKSPQGKIPYWYHNNKPMRMDERFLHTCDPENRNQPFLESDMPIEILYPAN